MTDPDPLYTETPEDVLAFLPYFTAPLSVVGAGLTLWAIWFDRRTLLQQVYQRIMLALSILNLITSLAMIILGPWAVPADYAYGRSGRGHVATCEASGFFLTLYVGTIWYSTFLAIQFVLLLRWEWKDRKVAYHFELHGWSIATPLAYGIAGIADDVFNPVRDLPGWCWFSDNPPFCVEDDENNNNNNNSNSTTCVRGSNFKAYSSVVFLVIAAWAVIIVCMILIVHKVRQIERNLHRYTVTANSNESSPNYVRTKATAVQGLWYIAAFFITYAPPIISYAQPDNRDNATDQQSLQFLLALLVKTFTPMQGFFNAILYFRGTFDTLIQDGKSLAFLRRLPLFGPFIEQRVAKRTAASLRRRGAAEGRPRNGGGTLNITSITDVPVVTLENTTVGNSEVGTAIEEDPMTPNHPPETITSMAVLTTTTKTTTPDSSSGEKNETERSATSHSLPETAPRTSSTITPSFAVVSHTPLDARAHTVGGRIEQDEESSCLSNECYNDEEGQPHCTNQETSRREATMESCVLSQLADANVVVECHERKISTVMVTTIITTRTSRQKVFPQGKNDAIMHVKNHVQNLELICYT